MLFSATSVLVNKKIKIKHEVDESVIVLSPATGLAVYHRLAFHAMHVHVLAACRHDRIVITTDCLMQ